MTAATTPATDEQIAALIREATDKGDLIEASFALQLVARIHQEREKAVPEGHVKMPTNADEAAAMELIGHAWLKQNAPERLLPTPPALSQEERT